MGIKLGRGATVHADSIESQPEDSVTRCGRSADLVQGVTDDVTCKSCVKLTAKDVEVVLTEVTPEPVAEDMTGYAAPFDNGHSQGTADSELSAPTGDVPERPWVAQIQEGDVWHVVGLYGPWVTRGEAEAFARESALLSPGTGITYRAYDLVNGVEGDAFTASGPEVKRAAVDLVRAPLLATESMGEFAAEVSTLAEALAGDSGEDSAVQVRWLIQADRDAGWLTWPDAGPFTDRYEAISMAAGAAVGVPDSQWRVIGEVSGEIIWTGPVPVSASDLGIAPESHAEPRNVLTPTSGMVQGRADYTARHGALVDVTDGPVRFRSGPCGKRKIVVRRGRRH